MTLALVLMAVATALEIPLWWLRSTAIRRRLAWLAIILLEAGSLTLLILTPAVWTWLLVILGAYRGLNLYRILHGRIQPDYLFYSVRRGSLCLLAAQFATAGVVWLTRHYGFTGHMFVIIGLLCQIVGLAVIELSVHRQWRLGQPVMRARAYADRDLPSLTVAIPARNETEDLEACLQSLVASTYPKLEILVLDDCSQNRRTPEIIRGFAHDGVRFVGGTPPPENWLAKNHAYQQLADEANGALILFCGVDARFEPDSLRQIVKTLLEQKKTMLSWVPVNPLPPLKQIESLLLQPGRYGWEFGLPRWQLKRLPVLSTCWIIDSEQLRAAGGFKAVSHSISPESYFARLAQKRQNGYGFLVSTAEIGLSTAKRLDEQRETATRTRYPQLHRRLELVCLASLVEFSLFVLPFMGLVYALVQHKWPLFLMNLVLSLVALDTYARLTAITYRRYTGRGLWLAPCAALYDIAILHISLAKYEFGEVLWKGRNVCIPVMRVIPKLPTLPN